MGDFDGIEKKCYFCEMNLFDRVSEEIKVSMKAREMARLEALRGIKKEFLEARTAKGANGELSDEMAIRIMTRMVKQRRESARIYRENGREELAAAEEVEAGVIEEFLPRQLSEQELEAEVSRIIASTGATGMADMGRVMGVASKELAGRAQGGAISAMVRRKLQQ